MMDIPQIENKLTELFGKHRVIFWNDAEGAFEESLSSLGVADVTVIRPDKIGQFKTKVQIELEEPKAKFLVYSATDEPDYEDDWLLDIRLYSYQFTADRASVLIDELGLQNHHLRDYLNSRKKFFANKVRANALKQYVLPTDMEKDIDLKMLTVLTKAEHDDFFEVIRTIYKAVAESEGGLDAIPSVFEQIQKVDLEAVFWEFVSSSFGYVDEKPSLKSLLMHLIATDLAFALSDALPESLKHFILLNDSNVAVCLAQWRDSNTKGASYDKLSNAVADMLQLEEVLDGVKLERLLEAQTCLSVDRVIIRELRDRVIQTCETINADDIRAIAQTRQDKHWANNVIASSQDVPREALHSVYEAIIAAAQFYEFKNVHSTGFIYPDAKKMLEAYRTDLFKFDQLYRRFNEHSSIADGQGWGLLKDLQEQIEPVYCNWYLKELAMAWGKLIEPNTWHVDGVANQFSFYDKYIAPIAGKTSGRGTATAYVIISDAFRYEAANELASELNSKYRFKADLQLMLGVLPSYTAPGMAALLPHNKIEYCIDGDILVDGISSASHQLRQDILSKYNGIAIKADELLALKKDEGRELVRTKDVVYIYHDTVDKTGESNEKQTVHAVRRAIDELSNLVRYVVNNLNGTQVFVTADHGFLYSETKPDQTGKNKLGFKPDAVKTNKRFLIGNNLPDIEDSYSGKLSVTAGVDPDSDMAFVLPKGLSLFHFVGGSQFVHGGMSLQEVVIPVVCITAVKGKQAELTKERKVSVQVLGANHRITTSRYRFQLLQTDAVSDRVKAITLRVALFDGDKEISDIQLVSFDSSSDNMADRTKNVTLNLKKESFDKNKVYHLILRDAEDKTEKQRVEVKIDQAFGNDF